MSGFEKLSAHMIQQPKLKYYVSDIDATKLHLKTFFRMYSTVTQSMFEWCDTAIPLLTEYLEEYTTSKYDIANSKLGREISTKSTLVIGILKMQTAQVELSESKFRFNHLLLKIVQLELNIRKNFDAESDKFKEKHREFERSLESIIRYLESNVADVKHQLTNEIEAITELKITIKNTKGLIFLDAHPELEQAFRKHLIKLVEKSISKCKHYITKDTN